MPPIVDLPPILVERKSVALGDAGPRGLSPRLSRGRGVCRRTLKAVTPMISAPQIAIVRNWLESRAG